jgi:hypothetical protein
MDQKYKSFTVIYGRDKKPDRVTASQLTTSLKNANLTYFTVTFSN